ncbi:MAG: hypothetical protein EP344_14955 [Bacteroidetes bacterium]|nr:MAG: hypothetical protein EP344_14955 [Bacteroidota bacterium]
MQNNWKVIRSKPLALLLFLGMLTSACTNVYFEKPVPQNGTELRSFPSDWSGVYLSKQAQQEDLSDLEQILQQCFRLDRVDDRHLLVSSEYRIHERNWARLRSALETEKKEGRVQSFQLSETAIWCVLNTDNGPYQQYTTLIKDGPWYILPQTLTPFRQYDLEQGIQTEFEARKPKSDQHEWLPNADSLELKVSTLVARQKDNNWYFNTRPEEDPKWSLLHVRETEPGKLTVQLSNIDDTDAFKNREEYFNQITPFTNVDGNNYLIDPTDKALDQLLSEEGLFQTYYLSRME